MSKKASVYFTNDEPCDPTGLSTARSLQKAGDLRRLNSRLAKQMMISAIAYSIIVGLCVGISVGLVASWPLWLAIGGSFLAASIVVLVANLVFEFGMWVGGKINDYFLSTEVKSLTNDEQNNNGCDDDKNQQGSGDDLYDTVFFSSSGDDSMSFEKKLSSNKQVYPLCNYQRYENLGGDSVSALFASSSDDDYSVEYSNFS